MKFENYVKILGENLKELRMKEGLTVRKMARAIHIPRMHLRMLESSILPSGISVAVLFAIEKRFDISPADMFTPRYFANEKHILPKAFGKGK